MKRTLSYTLKYFTEAHKLMFIIFKVVKLSFAKGKGIYTTRGGQVLSTCNRTDLGVLMPCKHEKADTRLMIRIFDAAAKGHSKIKICSSDTDVVAM